MIMTNEYIMKVAMEQSAEDIGCQSSDFSKDKNVVVPISLGEHAKKYYEKPVIANFISYGSNIVAGASEELMEIVKEYLDRFTFYHCFETPNLYWLDEKIAPLGYKVCFMAEYYLPDTRKLTDLQCEYELRVLEQKDFTDLYLPEWSNAICKERKEYDVLGVGAYDGDKLVGLAACSADADEMWQIGIDVLPEYRRKGIASAATVKLAKEIMARGKVPFYCSAWSNLRSVKNAFRCGFVPAWVEMTVKPEALVNEFNKTEEN